MEKDPEKYPLGETDKPLPESDLVKVPEELKEKLQVVIDLYKELWDASLGLIKEAQNLTEVRPEANLVRQDPYKAGTWTRQVEAEQVELMRSIGVIEPATGEWAIPEVIVPESVRSPRCFIEYRKRNDQIVKDAYSIRRMDECSESLGDANVFSTLDFNADFWQIPEAEGDRPPGLHVPSRHVAVRNGFLLAYSMPRPPFNGRWTWSWPESNGEHASST